MISIKKRKSRSNKRQPRTMPFWKTSWQDNSNRCKSSCSSSRGWISNRASQCTTASQILTTWWVIDAISTASIAWPWRTSFHIWLSKCRLNISILFRISCPAKRRRLVMPSKWPNQWIRCRCKWINKWWMKIPSTLIMLILNLTRHLNVKLPRSSSKTWLVLTR